MKMLFTKRDVGCWIDGIGGHESLRIGLARMIDIYPDQQGLINSLYGEMPDDRCDEDEALEVLQAHTAKGLFWVIYAGDLLLMTVEEVNAL